MTVVYDNDIKTDTSGLYRDVADMLNSLSVAENNHSHVVPNLEKRGNRHCRKDCPACLAIAKAKRRE